MTLCDSEGLENAWQQEGPTVVNQFSRTPPQGYSSTSEPPTVIYEGYKFFKADPIPGEEASWTKVERTKMLMTQSDFCRKVQKRANKISAAQQYQFLSEIRQAHINQLIAERRLLTPEVEWSCVYAKEREKPSKARNAHRDDYEIVSMQIILMQRPVKTKTHFRTPMGDLVDLGVHFGPRPDKARWSIDEETHGVKDTGLLPRNRDRFVPSFPRPRRSQTFSGNEARQDRLERESLPRPATATAIRRRPELNDQRRANVDDEEAAHLDTPSAPASQDTEGYSSENDMEEETASLHRTISNQSSTVGSSGNTSCTCQDSSLPQKSPFGRQHSPSHYRFTFRSNPGQRPLIVNRYFRGRLRNEWYSSTETIPAKRPLASIPDEPDTRLREKRICLDQMDKEEMRSRILDCEARIEQWEKTLQNQTRILGLQMRIQGSPEPLIYE